MPKLYANPTHKAKIGYNGFDMSQLLKFTSTTGELLPVYYDFLQPGDKVTCSSILKTRTMPLASAAMCSIKERIEWFFVPLNQLFSIFEDWYFGIKDFKSSFFDANANEYRVPYIEGSTLANEIGTFMVTDDYYFNDTNFPGENIRIYGTQLRLMELLGLNPVDYKDYNDSPSISCWLPCAYQKIYMDYYRLSDREAADNQCYNLDRFYMNPSQAYNSKYFTLRYRPREKDYFTSNYVSPVLGSADIGAFGDLTTAFKNFLASFQPETVSQGVSVTQFDTSEPTDVSQSLSTVNQNSLRRAFSTSNLRATFAMEKLLEITRRSGKHFDKQMLAHFGVDVSRGISGEVYFLGKEESSIVIGDVISTAETSEGPLGQIAGKGYNYGKSNHPIKFEADCHGILMAIYSAEPVSDYPSFGLDKLNTLIDRSSYFTPEFDNLGMSPQFVYEQNLSAEPIGTYHSWQYRYWELKNKYNRVCGALRSGRNLDFWTTQYVWPINLYCDYLVSPLALNDIMLQDYTFITHDETDTPMPLEGDELNSLYGSDPLMHELYFDVKKASKMSTYALPSL